MNTKSTLSNKSVKSVRYLSVGSRQSTHTFRYLLEVSNTLLQICIKSVGLGFRFCGILFFFFFLLSS